MIIKKSPSLLFMGHNFFDYMSNENTKYAYIPIPKNASSYLKIFFESGWGWTYDFNYYENSNKKFIVCLRDPINRWLAGVVEYFFREHPYMVLEGETFLKFICQRVIFDEHTIPQVNFIDGLDDSNLIFIKFNDSIGSTIDKFVTEHFNDSDWKTRKLALSIDKNDSNKHIIKQTNLENLKTFLQENPKLIYNIKKFYKEDYDLINSAKYYGT